MGNDVTVKVGVHGAAVKTGLAAARQDFERFGEDINRTAHRKFGIGDIFKSTLASFNIGSVEGVVDYMTESWKKQLEQANGVLESLTRQIDLQEQLIKLRHSDANNVLLDKAKEEDLSAIAAKKRAEADDAARFAAEQNSSGGLVRKAVNFFGRASGLSKLDGEETADERATRLQLEATKAEEAALKSTVVVAQNEKKARDEKAAADKKAAEVEAGLQKDLAALQETNARKRLSLEEEIARVRAQQAELAAKGDTASRVEAEKKAGELIDLEKRRDEEAKRAAAEITAAQDKLQASRDKVADTLGTPAERIANLQARQQQARTASDLNYAVGDKKGGADQAARANDLGLELESTLRANIQKAVSSVQVGSNGAIGLSSAGVNVSANPETSKMVDLLKSIDRTLREENGLAPRPITVQATTRGYSP